MQDLQSALRPPEIVRRGRLGSISGETCINAGINAENVPVLRGEAVGDPRVSCRASEKGTAEGAADIETLRQSAAVPVVAG